MAITTSNNTASTLADQTDNEIRNKLNRNEKMKVKLCIPTTPAPGALHRATAFTHLFQIKHNRLTSYTLPYF